MPENQKIINFIEETQFDLIIADPIEMLGPLLSWKYNIPLSFNTRWAMYGDAGELLTGESIFDHLVLTHWTVQFGTVQTLSSTLGRLNGQVKSSWIVHFDPQSFNLDNLFLDAQTTTQARMISDVESTISLR